MNLLTFLANKELLVRGSISIFTVIVIGITGLFFSKNLTSQPTEDIKQETTAKKTSTKKLVSKPTITPTKMISYPTWTPTPTITAVPTNTPAPTNTPGPTSTPTATPMPSDTEAPHTYIYYPQNGGELTWKMDGKVCAVLNPPSDNQSTFNEIGVSYHFDGDTWSDYKTSTAYLCRDTLSNGPHSLTVKARDKAGNIEQEQTINFTVNIEGN